MQGEEGLVVRGRVEIDTRQPFRSVKEAVMLFGEKILAGEIYGNKLKEVQKEANNVQSYTSKFGVVTTELEETKQSLQRAKEEENLMAHCLDSLRQELENTKRELQLLKARERSHNLLDEPEIEEIKFVENTSTKVDVAKNPSSTIHEGFEFQKKRSVKFASPPLLTKVIVTKDNIEGEEARKEVNSHKKKPKRKTFPLIGGLFSKKGVQRN